MDSFNSDNPHASNLTKIAKDQVVQTTVKSVSTLVNEKTPEGTPTVEQVQQGGQLVQTGVQVSQQIAGKLQKEPAAPPVKTFRNTAPPPPPADTIENEPEDVSTEALESIYEQTQWKILIDGKPISRIVSFELKQSFNSHHTFTLRVYHSELEEPRTYRIDQTKDLLGKSLTAILGSHLKDDRVEFAGIITGISFHEANGLNGEVIVSGYSPTILLESGTHLHSFYNKNLETIAKEVTERLAGKLDVSIKPRYTQQLKYVAQHEESNFQFLRRLASWYGDWLYYDGKKLCLGKPDTLPKYKLYYARQIEGLQMDMQVSPMNFSYLSYQSSDDKVLKQQPPKRIDGLNFYGDLAVEKSDEVFSQKVKSKPVQRAGTHGALEHVATVTKATTAGNSFTVTGTCKVPYLVPGTKVTVMLGENELGEYLITEVDHQLTTGNQYTSHFKAVAGDINIIPTPILQAPACEPQLAVVKKNDDPDGQGRVRVQFQWQEGDNLSDWVRVLTPDAGGGGDKVAKNRGFVFIPEVGDLVMVAFRDGNPDMPFVMGSMFHGKVGGGGGQGNKSKSLTTRSGSTVTLDDDKGSVTVNDPSGNTIILHGDGTMTIKAPNKLTIESKEIHVLAENDLNVASANTKVNVTAKAEVNISSEGKIAVDATGEIQVASKAALKMEAPMVEVTAKANLKAKGAIVDVEGQATTNVKGGIVNIN
jgi:uncharacterized protein involved in type VI secretion and phage assembly